MRAHLAHTSGSLVRACPVAARLGFTRFKVQQWRVRHRSDRKGTAQHKSTFAVKAYPFLHVRRLSNFMCPNSRGSTVLRDGPWVMERKYLVVQEFVLNVLDFEG